jgi:hypothetical protein
VLSLKRCQPATSDKIEVHKTEIHPLPAFEVDEASIVGNVDVNDSIDEELELDQNQPEYNRLVRINAGDQLTQARQRAILAIRGGHEDAARAYKGRAFMPGLFHGKMTDIHGLLKTHFGKPHAGNRSPSHIITNVSIDSQSSSVTCLRSPLHETWLWSRYTPVFFTVCSWFLGRPH